MEFSKNERSFLLNGKEVYLYSGEIHYFRIDPRLWPKHLKALKEAGCMAASTYICWDWHEYEKGKFDFTGTTHPRRNLVGYLELCKKMGVYCIVKPGPYILAEYHENGLPGYLLREDKEILAVNEQGKRYASDIVTLMHPKFLSATYGWYDQVMPIIKRFEIENGGPVIMMQVCNEVGVLHWLSAQADFSPVVMDIYRQFLEKRFKNIAEYNRIAGENFSSFSEALPPSGHVKDLKHFAAYNEWHIFWRHYFALYLKTLVKKIRGYGIKMELIHNVPGWIFGGASELPMMMTLYDEVIKSCPEISFGLDHIPEYMSFRNAHNDLPLNQILKAVQGRGPVWSIEFQAGTREHHVRNSAREMDLFYKASLAHDLVGSNFYMFSQGENPEGKGAFSRKFYWQTPLSSGGEKSVLYDVAKNLGIYLKVHGEKIIKTDVKAEIGVGFYKPYYYTELISSQIMAVKKLDSGKIGLQYDPRFIREAVFFDGLLRCLQAINFNYRVADLENVSVEEMLKFKQFWVTAAEYMDEKTQKKLADFVEAGGHLILYPCLPSMDCRMQPCTLLKERLGVQVEKKESSNKISILDFPEIFTLSGRKEIYSSKDMDVIARTADGDACGIEKRVGKGKATLVGVAFGYSSDDHLMLFEAFVERSGVKRDVEVSDPEVNAVLRRGKGYAYLFLMNYLLDDKKVKVTVPKAVLKEIGLKKKAQFSLNLPAVSAKIVKLG